MKKALLLTLVMVVSASVAAAQPGVLGTYADPAGLSCNVVDGAPGLLSVFVVQTLTGGSTGCEFASPTPACMIGAMYLAWGSPFGAVVGNPVVGLPGPIPPPAPPGVAIGYGACLAGTINIGSISYFGAGLSAPCCAFPIIPSLASGTLGNVSCVPALEPVGALANTINGNATCDCNTVPTQDATWGAVKSLYQ